MPAIERPKRRSIRLRDFDYAQAGAYFVIICSSERKCLFGEIVSGAMWMFAPGFVVEEEWLRTAVLRPYVELDAFVVMPNHLHGIIVLDGERATHRSCPYSSVNGVAG